MFFGKPTVSSIREDYIPVLLWTRSAKGIFTEPNITSLAFERLTAARQENWYEYYMYYN